MRFKEFISGKTISPCKQYGRSIKNIHSYQEYHTIIEEGDGGFILEIENVVHGGTLRQMELILYIWYTEMFSQDIESEEQVRNFFTFCIEDCELGMGFHPDTSFDDYTEDPFMSKGHIPLYQTLDNIMDSCFEYCDKHNIDIYLIGLEILGIGI